MIEIGIDSFAALSPDTATGRTLTGADRVANLLEEVEAADHAGLDVFGIGEHHRAEFLDSAPAILLAAAAAQTKSIRLTSAVTVLSAADPVRVFQEFATLDLVSAGRAEIVGGRGSFGEAYALFGLERDDYDALFAEKLGLLLKIRDDIHVTWTGRYRPPLTGQGKVLAASEALGGISRLKFQMSSASLEHGAMLRSIELLGTEVAPVVRAASTGLTNTCRNLEVSLG